MKKIKEPAPPEVKNKEEQEIELHQQEQIKAIIVNYVKNARGNPIKIPKILHNRNLITSNILPPKLIEFIDN